VHCLKETQFQWSNYEGARGGLPPERPDGPLETPGLRGYKGASEKAPLKSPVKFNTWLQHININININWQIAIKQ